MRYVAYDTVRQNMGAAVRTVRDFGHFLGRGPHKLGIAADLYPGNTAMQLLDRLYNVHQLKKNPNKPMSLQSISDITYEWGIKLDKVKLVRIVEDVTNDGRNQQEIDICLEEPYFFPNDTFVIEGSRDQLFVTAPGVKLTTTKWRYTCKLVTSDPRRGIDLRFANTRNHVRFRSNYYPELSESRNSRYQSNIELSRQHLSLHGVEVRKSGQYSLQEHTFIADNTNASRKGQTSYYRLDPAEKRCYDEFMEVRNRHLLFGESNFNDRTGKCNIQTPDGRDIPMGDGIITQLERYAEKFAYSNLTTGILRQIIQSMRQKSQTPQNNKYVILCNEQFQTDFYDAMIDELSNFQLPATALYSKINSKDYKIDVGANFESYFYLGNQITIVVEREMTIEYPDRAYGIFMDVTKDLSGSRPAIESFTLEGADMITGTLKGLGGTSGKESGDVASMIHGSSYAVIGYSGSAVYNPYRSFIVEQNTSTILM